MAHYRVSIGFQKDSEFPRDAITINPHYNGDDAQGLADRLKANLLAHGNVGPTTPFTVKVYDTTKPPPNYPLATAVNITPATPSTAPREVALCLSYYATWNRPSFRGRLFIPHFIVGGALGLRPSDAQLAAVLAFKQVLNSGLPQGTIWEVWSPKLNQGSGVSHVWCDDEWDTVRSRGLRGTKRFTESAAP
jgi:hypothetical protein